MDRLLIISNLLHLCLPPPCLDNFYANRESVIRATARQTPTGVFYGDQQTGPLPTPPGSESSYDNQYLQLHSTHPKELFRCIHQSCIYLRHLSSWFH
ncbi:Protein trachealess [Eumeta japonica]|uniref:Protein trachealess n=1 Tax=Eumeta variegata TaxID=151549 RepID=A0A4C1SPJ4_EUMVA|nr:Protein trachealess [Eumeta japonica]